MKLSMNNKKSPFPINWKRAFSFNPMVEFETAEPSLVRKQGQRLKPEAT
ncbi:hypothetical protein [Halobacillus mangrovi]|nr:hypothetical protein [Halobacillus mangrovi]